VFLATALLVFATPGCDTPTAIGDAPDAALVPGNAQSRIALCHRTNSGGYTEITVADAAYSTHMDHGDRAVGDNGECPTAGTARLQVTVNLNAADWQSYVTVVLYVTGEPEAVLGGCYATETCTYDVPDGSSTLLLSPNFFTYTWSDPSCTITGSSSSCVMDGDRSVVVTEPIDEY
jgi:hypothetical protein